MAKVSIVDMAKAIVSKHRLSQQEAEKFVTALFDVINEGLYRDKIVKVKGLGTFKVIDVRERESVNVNTGERVVIESHGKITFTPDPIMRDLVNKPFAQFETVVLNEGVDIEEISKVNVPDTDISGQDGDVEYDDEQEEQDLAALQNNGTESSEELIQDDVLVDENPVAEPVEAPSDSSVDDVVDDNEIADDGDLSEDSASQDDGKTTEGLPADDGPVCSGADDDGTVCDNSRESSISPDVEPEKGDDSDNLVEEQSEIQSTGFISRNKWACFTVLTIVIAAAAFTGGYYWGKNTVVPVVKYRTERVVVKSAQPKSQADSLQRTDTVALDETVNRSSDTLKKAEVKGKEPIDEIVPKATAKGQSLELKNAQAMVNTGAYRITGTAQTVEVKRGETLEKISRFYLGAGMECYIQVHNGISEVKEGMRLKIPKLELKRKKR